MTAPILAIDLDGVLATYHGWRGPQTPIGDPLPGAALFVRQIEACGWEPVLYTGRDPAEAAAWLQRHGMRMRVVDVRREGKPMATAFLDDRAVRFTGNFGRALVDIEAQRRPWWDERGLRA